MPVVAIVGRPNVGKSTLFNRLVGYRKAITHGEPGVTRDLNYGEVDLDGLSFTLVDTGGFEPDIKEGVLARVKEQVQLAIEEADLIVCLMDGRAGLSPGDKEIVDMLRITDKPVIYAVNKIDTPRQEALIADFFALGVEPVLPISCEHKRGLERLVEEIRKRLPPCRKEEAVPEEVRIAIVGRPNVGKSTLVNRILGFERVIVSAEPGTTRDLVDTVFKRDERSYRIMDTAGIRRRSRISSRIESYSVMAAIRGIEGCHVAVLLIDGLEGVTAQDARIAGLIEERGKGCIIAINKWDLAKNTIKKDELLQIVKEKLYFVDYAPVLFISALTGEGVEGILDLSDSIVEEMGRRVPTSLLNRLVKGLTFPAYRGRPIKVYYITQKGVFPPTFLAFVNRPEGIKEAYRRYMVRRLREAVGLNRVPVRLVIRKSQ